jgi:hypothetical protein
MTTRRLSAFRSSRTVRLTPRPIRSSTECASSSQCQRSRTEETAEEGILVAGHPAFVTLSACALNETDKITSERIGTLNLLDTSSTPRGPDFGGARRDRTDDLMLAKHALSQLSYGPVSRPAAGARRLWWAWEDLNLRPHAYQARALTN